MSERQAPPIEHDDSRRRRVHEPASASMSLNMTPMIDVVFLLLVYFVLGSNFGQQERGLRADVPEIRSSQQAIDPFELPDRPLVLQVGSRSDRELDFTLGADDPLVGSLAPGPGLSAALSQALESLYQPDHEVVISPVSGTRWEHTLEVYNAALGAGFVRIRFGAPGAAR